MIHRALAWLFFLGMLMWVPLASAQAPAVPPPPLTLTLQDAVARARQNSPQFLSAAAEARLAHEDKVQARAGLLPSASYELQYLYTEGNGTPSGRFIANNAVHEYVSEGNAHQVLDLAHIADFRRARAAEALASAKAEIALRGLVATVVKDYYALIVAERRYANVQAAATEAQRFLTISQRLEQGGEVAHADVIKAQLQYNDRSRDLQEARLGIEKSRLDLAVLLFPDFNQNFTVVDDLRLSPPLPPADEIRKLAMNNNPELRAASAALGAAGQEVLVAWSGHLPSLSFDYWYGIDAAHFATHTGPLLNLGYAAAATLNLPVWNWGATESKVKQAKVRREQARVEFSAAQRQLLADLQSFYGEAATARSELDTLRESADLASESLRLANLRYQAGETTVLEVVDAQNALVQAQSAYDEGEARYRVGLAALQTLSGPF